MHAGDSSDKAKPTMRKRTLDPMKIADTAKRLSTRINERFPEAGLYKISKELISLGDKASEEAPKIARPIYSVRIAVGILITAIGVIVVSMIWAAIQQVNEIANANLVDIVGALEAGTNELFLIGLVIFFLISLETRIKRSQAVRAIHELRSIAHVIDMHQLSKDPAALKKYSIPTKSSPQRDFTVPELIRYLDYCSEMLSLTSKIAALYLQRFNDSVVLEAVSDVETLCTGLTNKIWQKLQIAESVMESSLRTAQ